MTKKIKPNVKHIIAISGRSHRIDPGIYLAKRTKVKIEKGIIYEDIAMIDDLEPISEETTKFLETVLRQPKLPRHCDKTSKYFPRIDYNGDGESRKFTRSGKIKMNIHKDEPKWIKFLENEGFTFIEDKTDEETYDRLTRWENENKK